MTAPSPDPQVARTSLVAGVVGVIVRPWLWPTALRLGFQVVPIGWWKHAPRLPRPDADFVAFRVSTAYGEHGRPRGEEFVEYLEWVRAHRRARHDAS